MKLHSLLYIISIISLVAAILLLVLYPDSGRMSLIAGLITSIGFTLNIAGFLMKKG
jgi:hypothetical protein